MTYETQRLCTADTPQSTPQPIKKRYSNIVTSVGELLGPSLTSVPKERGLYPH